MRKKSKKWRLTAVELVTVVAAVVKAVTPVGSIYTHGVSTQELAGVRCTVGICG